MWWCTTCDHGYYLDNEEIGYDWKGDALCPECKTELTPPYEEEDEDDG